MWIVLGFNEQLTEAWLVQDGDDEGAGTAKFKKYREALDWARCTLDHPFKVIHTQLVSQPLRKKKIK